MATKAEEILQYYLVKFSN